MAGSIVEHGAEAQPLRAWLGLGLGLGLGVRVRVRVRVRARARVRVRARVGLRLSNQAAACAHRAGKCTGPAARARQG